MRAPDDILKCVGFVAEYIEDPSGEYFEPEGTGFIVNIRSQVSATTNFFVFVTAKHVAESLKERMTVITVNKKGGGLAVLDTDDKWYLHGDESVDAAAIAVNVGADLDVKSIPLEMFLLPELMDSNKIGVGDEVYFPGLFTYAPNEKRNLPILRHGNIAMLPNEPIQVESKFAEVYLIEARSIGGISGSPVFVRGTTTFINDRGEGMHGLSGRNYLLGLIHGHWDIKEADINNPSIEHDRKRGVNLGIAVVVPSQKLLEVINHPGLVAIREAADAEIAKRLSAPET